MLLVYNTIACFDTPSVRLTGPSISKRCVNFLYAEARTFLKPLRLMPLARIIDIAYLILQQIRTLLRPYRNSVIKGPAFGISDHSMLQT